MYAVLVSRFVLKELSNPKRYPAKIFRQIVLKIFELSMDPFPQDYKHIGEGYRVDVGEYRIYYEVNQQERTVTVLLVGKRGDDQIYRELKRRFG
ncbi:MAG TPA: type II toxin-antitoxin system RelE/ParE family toxin [Caldilineae bacterium]|nr:type II toxin-antitoxin system RelE/ParE family toxin [Caldilineae bacterium]